MISASRRPQKVLDSPQSVSIISSRDLENSANITDPIRSLVNIPGVQLQQQSANVINIEMRSVMEYLELLHFQCLITETCLTLLHHLF